MDEQKQNKTGETTEKTPKAPEGTNDNKTLMGVLSYLGPLVIIPFLVSKENTFVKFHIKQGLVLLVLEVLLWIAAGIFWPLMPIVGIIEFGVFVLAIIGIVNVVGNKEQELPLVGQFSKHFNI